MTRKRGVVKGVVTLDTSEPVSGSTVQIINTEFVTTTDSTGRFEFSIPVGNFDGVSVTRRYYSPAQDNETVTVTDYGVYNVPALALNKIALPVSGHVQRYDGEGGNIQVMLTGQEGSALSNVVLQTLTDESGSYLFDEGFEIVSSESSRKSTDLTIF